MSIDGEEETFALNLTRVELAAMMAAVGTAMAMSKRIAQDKNIMRAVEKVKDLAVNGGADLNAKAFTMIEKVAAMAAMMERE